jgi:hypothetical protein
MLDVIYVYIPKVPFLFNYHVKKALLDSQLVHCFFRPFVWNFLTLDAKFLCKCNKISGSIVVYHFIQTIRYMFRSYDHLHAGIYTLEINMTDETWVFASCCVY